MKKASPGLRDLLLPFQKIQSKDEVSVTSVAKPECTAAVQKTACFSAFSSSPAINVLIGAI